MQQVIPWPNGLGLDIGQAEIWKHAAGFRVFTNAEYEWRGKVLFVSYAVTTDPLAALELAEKQGVSCAQLGDLEYREAEAMFQAATPVQVQLF